MDVKQQRPIAVLGSGSWGTALALVLARNNQRCKLWGPETELLKVAAKTRRHETYLPGVDLPDLIEIETELENAVDGVRDVLMVVPSHAFRSMLKQIDSLMATDKRIAWGTKGLDAENGKLLHQVVQEELGEDIPIAALSGPTFATEVAAGLGSAITLACIDDDFANDMIERMQSTNFRVQRSRDIVGVQVGGIVKNVSAVAAGMCDGLELGANTRCAVITQGLAEMVELGVALGAEPETFLGLSGVGDLILTAGTDESRNRRFGLALGQGLELKSAAKSIGQEIEAVNNVKIVYDLAHKMKIKMPVTEHVYQVLQQQLSPRDAMGQLLAAIG